MTLLDLCRLMKKYWVLILVCMLVCGAAATAFSYLRHSGGSEEISATANIVGNSQAGGVKGLATEEGRQVELKDGTKFGDPDCEYELKVDIETGTTTVTVTVSGPDEQQCIDLANDIAERTCDKAFAWYPGSDYRLAYDGHVERATMANVTESAGPSKKYILVGLLGGLFLGVCIVVIIDLIRRPIKSVEGMQDLVELPVLEKLPATNGERLLANVRFASGIDDLKRVCVVPLGDSGIADEVAKMIESAMATEKPGNADADEAVRDTFFVQACAPLSQNMSAAYESRGADAAIVVGRQWTDSLTTLETTVAELKLAGTNVAGLVFAQKK